MPTNMKIVQYKDAETHDLVLKVIIPEETLKDIHAMKKVIDMEDKKPEDLFYSLWVLHIYLKEKREDVAKQKINVIKKEAGLE